MSSILGLINLNKNKINENEFNNSLNELEHWQADEKKSYFNNNIAFGELLLQTTPESRNEELPYYNEEAKTVIVADARIDNRNELIELLKIKESIAANLPDSKIILMAYNKWGADCLNYFIGDFAFAIYNFETETLFCARDHFGLRPFNYYYDDNRFIFSSEIGGIIPFRDIDLSHDKQFIADTISIIKSETFRTTYNKIKRLPPAHYLEIKDNKINIKRYWELKEQKQTELSDNDFIAEFRNKLIEAVKCRIRSIGNVGTELSGGLDSSAITAIASKYSTVETFSHIMPNNHIDKTYPFKDERKQIKLVHDHCNIRNKNFVASENKGVLSALKNDVEIQKCITQQTFQSYSDELYESVNKQNIKILLSGFGGDEVVTSQSRGYLNEFIFLKQYKAFINELKTLNYRNIKIVYKLIITYIKINIPPLYKLLKSYKKEQHWSLPKFKHLVINADFMRNMDIRKRYLNTFIKKPEYNLQSKQIERITHNHVSERLEYCAITAQHYNIEYRYPLFDKRLIEFYLSAPANLKAKGKMGRYLFRKAIKDIVPKETQWRNDKSGATIPTVYIRFLKDIDKIDELIKLSENTEAKQYIDFNKFKDWFKQMQKQNTTKNKYINSATFYNYLKLMLFLKKEKVKK